MDPEIDGLVRGVGNVCIAASSLEWSLAYLTSVVRSWPHEKLAQVIGTTGRPLAEFERLARDSGAFQTPDQVTSAAKIAEVAKRLMRQRNRVVHSVMVLEMPDLDSDQYEAWHAKTDSYWPVIAADLEDLATNLRLCASQADALGLAWEDAALGRSESDYLEYMRYIEEYLNEPK